MSAHQVAPRTANADVAELVETLRGYLARLSDGKLGPAEIDPGAHLFDHGYVDSLSAVTFMAHVEEVRSDGNKTHWRATAPFGKTVEWDAEITEDVPGERIAWQSLEAADIDNSGIVRFLPAPGGRGTEVHVTLNYSVPAGKLGEAVAKYFGEELHQQLDDDLRRFKQVMETGQIVRSEGAPWGKQARKEFPQRPAQPLSDEEFADLAQEVSQ